MGENSSEEDIQNVRHQLGLDRPLYEQYVSFLVKAVQGDFGVSIRQQGQPAMGIVLNRYPATLRLAAGHFGLGHGSGAHGPDEYYLIESKTPKVHGYDGAVRSHVDYLFELAALS